MIVLSASAGNEAVELIQQTIPHTMFVQILHRSLVFPVSLSIETKPLGYGFLTLVLLIMAIQLISKYIRHTPTETSAFQEIRGLNSCQLWLNDSSDSHVFVGHEFARTLQILIIVALRRWPSDNQPLNRKISKLHSVKY